MHKLPDKLTDRAFAIEEFFALSENDQRQIMEWLITKANGEETSIPILEPENYHMAHAFSNMQRELNIPSKEDFEFVDVLFKDITEIRRDESNTWADYFKSLNDDVRRHIMETETAHRENPPE